MCFFLRTLGRGWGNHITLKKHTGNFGECQHIRIRIGLSLCSRFNFKNYLKDKVWWGLDEEILVSKKVSVSVSKNFGIEKSIGFGFEKFWYRKKYRYRKKMVSKKNGIKKNIWFCFKTIWLKRYWNLKSLGFLLL